ncbi:cell division protein FtsK, partial [Streptomyces sp. NPDC002346]
MNHDDESELFNRLEADMATPSTPDSGGDVVDLDKARSARSESADRTADRSADSHTARSDIGSDGRSGDPTELVMVDGPAEVGPGFLGRLMGAKRRAIVPAWLRSGTEFKTAARWAAGHYGHLAGYHALRSPYYAARLAFQSPRGAAKFVGGTMRWVADREGEPVRLASVRREDAAEYLKLSRQRDGRVRLRTLITVLAMFVGLGAALAIYVLAPGWLQALSVGAVLMALGSAGTQADAPVITRAVEMTKAPKLTSDIVLRALGALGITAINQAQGKGRDGFTFTAPITRDGPGWRAEGDLPYGVTVTDVIERRDKLASGLRRPLGCVWPEAVPDEHTGRLVLWVGDQDMSTATKPAWPLIKGGSVDLFKPVSFG